MGHTMYIFIIVCVLTYVLKQLLDIRYSKVQYYLSLFKFYFSLIVLATITLPYTLLKPTDLKNFKELSPLTKYVIKWLNLKFTMRDKHLLSMNKGAVIIANHQSYLDCLVMCRIIDEVDDELTPIVKKELFYLWPFGLSAYLCGVVFLDRKNTKSAYRQLQSAIDLILKRKAKIFFFPEGTRNKDYTKVLPFKKGAFYTAVQAQVPIIPVVLSPYYFINDEKCVFNKGSIVAQCLEPVLTTGLTMDDVPDLIKQCHDKITEACQRFSQEVNGGLEQDNPLFPSVE